MGKEIPIKLRTYGDTSGADQTAESLNQVGEEAQQAEQAGQEAGQTLEEQFKLAALKAAALAATIATARRALADFAEDQSAVAEIDAVLANSGELTDDYRLKLQELAGELQNTTAISNTEWLQSQKMLIQIGGANKDNIEEQITAVKNLAGIIGGDIQQASMLFARAMAGNAEMLQRYGIMVEKAEDGTVDLNKLQQDLARMGGGVLEARARTLAGGFDALDNKLSDLLKTFGRATEESGALGKATEVLGMGLDFWTEKLGGPIAQLDEVNNKLQVSKVNMEEAEAATLHHAAALDAIKEGAQDASSAIDQQVASIKDQLAAQNELAGLEEALEIAKVNANKDLSEVERLKQISEIKKKFAQEALNAEIKSHQKVMALRQQQAQELAEQATKQAEAVAAAEQAVTDLQGPAEAEQRAMARLNVWMENLQEFEKERERLVSQNNQFDRAWLTGASEEENGSAIQQIERVIDITKTQIQNLEAIKNGQGEANKKLQEAFMALDAQREAMTSVQELEAQALAKDEQTKVALNAEIERLQKVFELKQAINAINSGSRIGQAEGRAAQQEQSNQQAAAGAIASDIGAVTSGISGAVANKVNTAVEAVKTNGATEEELDVLAEALLSMADAVAQRDKQQAAKIEFIVKRVDELIARMRNNES